MHGPRRSPRFFDFSEEGANQGEPQNLQICSRANLDFRVPFVLSGILHISQFPNVSEVRPGSPWFA